MVVVRRPTDVANRRRAPVGSWLRRALPSIPCSRGDIRAWSRGHAGPAARRWAGHIWWQHTGRTGPCGLLVVEAHQQGCVAERPTRGPPASMAAAICLTTCSDASNRRDAGLTVGAQARLQGCWEAWAIGSSSSAAPWRRHVSRDWIGRMQEGMRSGGGGGNRGSAQGGVGRIAGRPCLVIRWQGHRGCMLCTTKTVACTVWTCLRSGFARERKCGRLAGPTIHQ